MKNGQRVIVKSLPWKGRRGTVVGRARVAWVIPCYVVECDEPDMFGRRSLRLRRTEMRKES